MRVPSAECLVRSFKQQNRDGPQPRAHCAHQPGVSAHSVPLRDLIRLHVVSVIGAVQEVQGEVATPADLRKNGWVRLGPRSVLDVLHASGVVGVRGAFKIAGPGGLFVILACT